MSRVCVVGAEGEVLWRKIIQTKLALPLRYETIEDLFSQKKTEAAGASDAQNTKKQQPTEVHSELVYCV